MNSLQKKIKHLKDKARRDFRDSFLVYLGNKARLLKTRIQQTENKFSSEKQAERKSVEKRHSKQQKSIGRNSPSLSKSNSVVAVAIEQRERPKTTMRIGRVQRVRRTNLIRARHEDSFQEVKYRSSLTYSTLLQKIAQANQRKLNYLSAKTRPQIKPHHRNEQGDERVRQRSIVDYLRKHMGRSCPLLSQERRSAAVKRNKANLERTHNCFSRKNNLQSLKLKKNQFRLSQKRSRFALVMEEVSEARRAALLERKRARSDKLCKIRRSLQAERSQNERQIEELLQLTRQKAQRFEVFRQAKSMRKTEWRSQKEYQQLYTVFQQLEQVLMQVRHGEGESPRVRERAVRLAGLLFEPSEAERTAAQGLDRKRGAGENLAALRGRMEGLRMVFDK